MPSFEDQNAVPRSHVAVPVVLCEDTQCDADYRYQNFVLCRDNMSCKLVRLFWNDTSLFVLHVVWIWQPKYPYKGVFLPFFCANSYQHRQKQLTLKTGHSTAIKPNNFFGQIRWQTEANICLHSMEASIIQMILLVLTPSLIYSTESVKTPFWRTRMRCGRTRNA